MSKQNIIIAILIVAVVGAGLWYTFSRNGKQNSPSNEEAVATVNGEEITSSDFQVQLEQAKQMYSQQKMDFKEEQLRAQVLDQMIGNLLIKQKAGQEEVTVKESEVNAQMNQVVQSSGGEQAFKKRLQEADLTREELRKRAREQLLVQSYLKTAIPEDKLEVTDQEIKSYFEQMVGQGGNATGTPSFEEMEQGQKEQIRTQLEQQKRRQETQNLIEKLRKEAEIKKSL